MQMLFDRARGACLRRDDKYDGLGGTNGLPYALIFVGIILSRHMLFIPDYDSADFKVGGKASGKVSIGRSSREEDARTGDRFDEWPCCHQHIQWKDKRGLSVCRSACRNYHAHHAVQPCIPHWGTAEARSNRETLRLHILNHHPIRRLPSQQASGGPHPVIVPGRKAEGAKGMLPHVLGWGKAHHLGSRWRRTLQF